MTGMEEIGEHSIQIKVHKTRPVFEQERVAQKHFFKREQAPRKAVDQPRLLVPPLIEAVTPEFSFLVPDERAPFRLGDELPPVNIIESEGKPLYFVFDPLPEDALHALEFRR